MEEKMESIELYISDLSKKIEASNQKKPTKLKCASRGYVFDKLCLYSQSYEDYGIFKKYGIFV